jgi:uncharacterized protein YkwD
MKTITHLITIIVLLLAPICGYCKHGDTSPLAAYSARWNDPKYRVCNTAEKVGYMTEKEKELIYVLNLARMNPKLFCETVLPRAHDISSFIDTSNEVYYKTLVATMRQMTPLNILQPDSLCMVSARCHATTSGKVGYVGHERRNEKCRKNKHYYGECCNYGSDEPLEILLLLLEDHGVPSLGHRKICLGTYNMIGVAIAPHTTYEHNAVMDFY